MEFRFVKLNNTYGVSEEAKQGEDAKCIKVINRYSKGTIRGSFIDSAVVYGNVYSMVTGEYLRSDYIEVGNLSELPKGFSVKKLQEENEEY